MTTKRIRVAAPRTDIVKTEAGPTGELTADQESRFNQLIDEIDAGIDAWRLVGERLFELRENRLYRATHKTFEAFVRDAWGWSRSHAIRALSAPAVAVEYEKRIGKCLQMETKIPQFTNEFSTRPMREVSSEKMDEVSAYLAEHVTDGRITEKVAKQAVDAVGRSDDGQDVEPGPETQVQCTRCKGTGWTLNRK